ncbi:hypothetical protein EB796_024301 [Bugula neritina]|uniref:Uncharacterized protein n=1 Tax=Bugula neritina TaxID=10212 RepID=A0A7J7IUZ2_BUGNE|nr:hypothetical protein EB796_024301 [Bugula neritina]
MNTLKYCVLAVLLFSLLSTCYGKLTCVTCRGILGSTCHLNADQVVHTESCDKCAVFARLQTTDGSLFEIVRDCAYRIFPVPVPAQYENTCKDDNAHFIECTHTCTSGDLCSTSLSYAPPGWNEDGSKSSASLKSYSVLLVLLASCYQLLFL